MERKSLFDKTVIVQHKSAQFTEMGVVTFVLKLKSPAKWNNAKWKCPAIVKRETCLSCRKSRRNAWHDSICYIHRRGNKILIKKPPYWIFDSFGIFNSKTYPPQIHVYVKLNFWRENSNSVDCQLKHLAAGCETRRFEKRKFTNIVSNVN